MTWSTEGVFAVAFDAFGTLLRSPEGAPTPTRWLRARDADSTAAERRFLTRQEGLKELANEYNSSELLPLIEWEALHSVSRMQMHKEAPSLLTRMREAGTRVALCADVPGPCSRAIRALVPRMDAYALSCDLSATTSERRFWEFVSCGLCCSPDEVLLITHDNVRAAAAARAAGLRTVVARDQVGEWMGFAEQVALQRNVLV